MVWTSKLYIKKINQILPFTSYVIICASINKPVSEMGIQAEPYHQAPSQMFEFTAMFEGTRLLNMYYGRTGFSPKGHGHQNKNLRL